MVRPSRTVKPTKKFDDKQASYDDRFKAPMAVSLQASTNAFAASDTPAGGLC